MKFTMWDHDGGDDFELIGHLEITVQELVDSIGSAKPLDKPLIHPQKASSRRGNIKIHVTSM